ncbi:MAG: PilZ domain-containing protein [Anaerolineales bacterium]|nr:PilZ domain-containing protein [Anaerolineales bacterium]
MDSNRQIIQDLRSKVGLQAEIDFLNLCKGVPLVYKGRLEEIRAETILFSVSSPDSICLGWHDHTTLLHDIFISGIHARVVRFDPRQGQVELGEFGYTDRGFGERFIVRVEPDEPLDASMDVDGQTLPVKVLDLSLNGFGLRLDPAAQPLVPRGKALNLSLELLGRQLSIPCQVLGVFPEAGQLRLAMHFASDAPGHATVARYISQRRAEIRQEILAAHQEATGEAN